jgi:hypothetical protein
MRVISSVIIGSILAAWTSAAAITAAEDKLVYADFERVENNRVVSNQGGMIQLSAYQETQTHQSTFKGVEGLNPPGPELVRIKKDDPNHATKFDYALMSPNAFAGVVLEIQGHPMADGKPVSDDVSGYTSLLMDVYATGIDALRIETISNGFGIDMSFGYPQLTFKVQPGMHTYKALFKAFSQPDSAPIKVDTKKILKNLTAVKLIAFCDGCQTNKQGMVVVDNVVFEK